MASNITEPMDSEACVLSQSLEKDQPPGTIEETDPKSKEMTTELDEHAAGQKENKEHEKQEIESSVFQEQIGVKTQTVDEVDESSQIKDEVEHHPVREKIEAAQFEDEKPTEEQTETERQTVDEPKSQTGDGKTNVEKDNIQLSCESNDMPQSGQTVSKPPEEETAPTCIETAEKIPLNNQEDISEGTSKSNDDESKDTSEMDTSEQEQNERNLLAHTQNEDKNVNEQNTEERKDEDKLNGEKEDKDKQENKGSKKRRSSGSSSIAEQEDEPSHEFPAENLYEYQWPPEKGGEYYMLQEQVSEYLQVLSFKRKYPDLTRRPVEMKERIFLHEKGVVTETQCDLGLTAVKSEEICDLMMKDYPVKYQEYLHVLQERERNKMKEKHKNYGMPSVDKNKMDMFRKKAVKSAADFNSQFMREWREERRAYFDLQTHEVHYPRGRMKVLPPWQTAVGPYPVTLIPGQYQNYYKKYSPQELKFYPINTCTYDPPKVLKNIYADPEEKSETEGSAASEDGLPTEESGSDSGSGSASASASDGEADHDGDKDEVKSLEEMVVGMVAMADHVSDTVTNEPVACNICKGGPDKNKQGQPEELVRCSECGRSGHPSCLELTEEMIPMIKLYPWQCMECKTCVECMDPYDEDKMMFCDHCDRGYHTFCVGLKAIPTGRWECPSCRPEEAKEPKPKRTRTR